MNYKIVNYTNPLDKTADAKFFPAPVYQETLETEQIAELVSHSTSLTPSDVSGVIGEIVKVFCDRAIYGSKLKINGLGTFKIVFGGNGRAQSSDVSADDIRNVRVSFIADSKLRKNIKNNISFTKAMDLTNKK